MNAAPRVTLERVTTFDNAPPPQDFDPEWAQDLPEFEIVSRETRCDCRTWDFDQTCADVSPNVQL